MRIESYADSLALIRGLGTLKQSGLTARGMLFLALSAPGGGYHIEHVVAGDTVTDVLKYVGHTREDLTARIRRAAEIALRNRRMTLDEARTLMRIYEQGLSGYTYLERD